MDLPAGELQKLQERLEVVLDHTLRDKSISGIARERKTSRPTVRKWIKRFEAEGLRGLFDRSSPGRPKRIAESVRDEIIRLTLETRPPPDLGEGRWTAELLAELCGISASHIANIWKEGGIDPPQHLQQVMHNPFRGVPLKINLQVPAWVKLNLELILKERDWTLHQYLLARLIDVDPDQAAGLEERREEAFDTLPGRWREALSKLPEGAPRSTRHRRGLLE